MKKDKLIKLLLSIEGNPDILLWNGYAMDWMDIKGLEESELVKMTKDYYIASVEREKRLEREDLEYTLPESEKEKLHTSYKKDVLWEMGEFIHHEDIKKGRYERKKVVYLRAKLRSIKTYDRIGEISY